MNAVFLLEAADLLNVCFSGMFVLFWLIVCFPCLVIGALIGKQEGRNIEVMNSFELMSHTIDDKVHIDKEYYYTKEEQCKLGFSIRVLY